MDLIFSMFHKIALNLILGALKSFRAMSFFKSITISIGNKIMNIRIYLISKFFRINLILLRIRYENLKHELLKEPETACQAIASGTYNRVLRCSEWVWGKV